MTTPANPDRADGDLPAGAQPSAGTAGQGNAGQNALGQNSTGQNSTGQNSTGQDADGPAAAPAKQPSLVPGVVLLVLAGVLIVITLLKPDLPQWLTVTIAGLAIVVVIALLLYAFKVFRDVTRPGGSR